jgi:nitrogen regulatory protein PII
LTIPILGESLQRGIDMIIDSETFAEVEHAITQATQGISTATQLVKGLGPQTEEARAYIGRLLNQILEVQIHIQRASAVLDAVKEANQEETSRQ